MRGQYIMNSIMNSTADINEKLLKFIFNSPTAYHAVESIVGVLEAEGYQRLREYEAWNVVCGGRYYIQRGDSSVLAVKIPREMPQGLMMAAAHSDSPALKIKESATSDNGTYVRLSVEKYGGMLLAPWTDRPLAVAGRVALKEKEKIISRLVNIPRPLALVPNVAIHMDRSANDGRKYDPASDMLPLFALSGSRSLDSIVAEAAGTAEENILSRDLFLYPFQEGTVWGAEREFISSPRLDDLQSVFGCLHGFLRAVESQSLAVLCIFDNEEVGSRTKQGAGSDFLYTSLRRLSLSLGMSECEFMALVSGGFMVSADNAHAVHPNHPELADRSDRPVPNGGVVIKYNADARYTTDSISAAVFSEICREAGVPVQRYTNRADIPGGSTLGNISLGQVSLDSVDIGLAQFAMHSCYETAGAKDTAYLIDAMSTFFSKDLRREADGIRISE